MTRHAGFSTNSLSVLAPSRFSAPSWAQVVLVGFACLALVAAAAPAQTVTEFSAGITASASPDSITAGPDGNLWFTEFNANQIGRITPAGVVTEFSAGITAGSGPEFVTGGPDGNVWFTEQQ